MTTQYRFSRWYVVLLIRESRDLLVVGAFRVTFKMSRARGIALLVLCLVCCGFIWLELLIDASP